MTDEVEGSPPDPKKVEPPETLPKPLVDVSWIQFETMRGTPTDGSAGKKGPDS